MSEDIWKDIRGSDFWKTAIEPLLQERLQEIYKGLTRAFDLPTMHMLQGGAAEIQAQLGDPAKEELRRARIAEHARNLPEQLDETEEEEDYGNRGSDIGSDRSRRLADRRWIGIGNPYGGKPR